jgi:ABC-type dipeptide/oligopeptide/nickel transport system permease component
MLAVTARRLFHTLPMLLVVSVAVFALLAAAPIDPARRALALAGAADTVDERDVEAKRVELGLDQPLAVRYLRWSADVIRLDLGESFVSKKPVATLIGERIMPSAVLAGVVLFASVMISLPLGILAAVRAGSAVDVAIRTVTLTGASLPGFWIALLAMWLFSVELGWLPALGSYTPAGIVLPALVLTLRTTGLLTRLTRATMIETLHADYMRTALAKGLSTRSAVLRHALPNAAIPILTVIGLDFDGLLAHAAVIEWVFAWPGLGRLGVEAALAGDVPVVLGFALTISVIVVATNFMIDLGYMAVDPRYRAHS